VSAVRSSRTPFARRLATIAALLALVACALGPRAEAQPRPRPWTPPDADSLQVWAAEIRTMFRAQASDSLEGDGLRAHDRVGGIAWRWLLSLGRDASAQAPAVEAALDSLGFDVDLHTDPVLPSFHFLVVRNPHRPTAHAMGVFLWWRGDRLLRQGMQLVPSARASFRVWWENEADAPYGWGLVETARDGAKRFHYLTLLPDGAFWQPRQFPGSGPDLTGVRATAWTEIDGDGRPELLGWWRVPPDTLFTECRACPARIGERRWVTRSRQGFALEEERVLPGPYATFTEFVRALVANDRAGASRLLARPEMLAAALKEGWGARRAPGTWKLLGTEAERWPRWLSVEFAGAGGPRRYVVRFKEERGRWRIDEWSRAAEDASKGARR
jgi:hypothetical protein